MYYRCDLVPRLLVVYRGTNAVDCRSLRAEYAIQTGNRTFIGALLRTPFELPTSWLFLSSQHVESLREQSRSGDCVFILLSDCIRSVLGYPRSIRYKSALQDIRVVVPGTSHSTTRSLKAVIRIRKGNLGCYSKRQPGDSGAAAVVLPGPVFERRHSPITTISDGTSSQVCHRPKTRFP